MTTAHRPTWTPAVGGSGRTENSLGQLSKQYSVRDQAAHTKLKFRQKGQGTQDEFNEEIDYKAQLEERERQHRQKRKAKETGTTVEALKSQEEAEKRLKMIQDIDPDLDADDDDGGDAQDDADDSDEDDDDDDDEAELLRELQRIKAERLKEAEEKEQARVAEEVQIRNENYLKANPLLQGNNRTDFDVNRRWDDDVVFKNCARNDEKKNEFVNDTLRSEFHRRFMSKYVQ